MKPSFRVLLFLLMVGMFLASCGGERTSSTASTPTAKGATTNTPSAGFGQPSTSLHLSGLVKNPGELRLTDLQAFSKIAVPVEVQPLGAHTFAGALLYDVLQKAQVITQSTRKNDLLRKSVVVSGTDGYTVAASWGELDPQFADKKILLAYEEDGKPLPQADGFVRLVVPGDVLTGRFVSNLVELQVVELAP